MAAFVIADTKIENAAEYEEYKVKAKAIAESYGGTYRARGGQIGREALEVLPQGCGDVIGVDGEFGHVPGLLLPVWRG